MASLPPWAIGVTEPREQNFPGTEIGDIDSKVQNYMISEPFKRNEDEITITALITDCPYCQSLKEDRAVLNNMLKSKNMSLKFVHNKENKNEFDELAQKHNINGVPFLIYEQKGKVLTTKVGYKKDDKESLISVV